MQISSSDVPYGTEVLVIVPRALARFVSQSKDRLRDVLSVDFPQYVFSFGSSIDDDGDDLMILAVSGKVGGPATAGQRLLYLDPAEGRAIADKLLAASAGAGLH